MNFSIKTIAIAAIVLMAMDAVNAAEEEKEEDENRVVGPAVKAALELIASRK